MSGRQRASISFVRILYGVTGCGLGHTMRARALAHHLVARGHQVKLAASGRATGILRRHGLDVLAIDGMTMRFAEGRVQRGLSVLDLLRRAPGALAHNAEVAATEVLAFEPDALVTDFDSFTSVLGVLLDRPVVSVDHQHVIDRFHHPRAVRRAVSSYRTARALVTAKTPRCAHYVVTSFFFPQPRWGSTTLVGPVVRPEVASASPTRGDHVLVYQTAAGDPRLLPALRDNPGVRFVLYGLGREETLGNVEVRPFDEARFVRELASARAVIANGGFTTLSEAVYLGKPVLSVPVLHQPEQELNAAWLDALGLGVRAERLDAAVVGRFLERAEAWAKEPDPRIRRGTEDATTALDRALAEAA
jgi:uncharacterized protein (TIGR00661 family)